MACSEEASCNAIVVKYYDKEKEPLEKGNLSCWLREAVDAAACERDRLGIPNPNPNSHPYHNPNPNPNPNPNLNPIPNPDPNLLTQTS